MGCDHQAGKHQARLKHLNSRTGSTRMSDSYQALLCTEYGDWRDLKITTISRAPLKPGQVRIRVRHAGVGFAVSLFVAGKYQRKPPLPFTPGTEAAGEILEVASDVTHLTVGQRVMAALDWGAFAQEVVTTADTVYGIPDNIALADAAALPITYGTVWSGLEWGAALKPGEVLLVHGASGSLGTAAVQVGRLMGATVIATASTEEKRAAAIKNGAHFALPSDPDELPDHIKKLCPRGGVDVVFDPVGGDLFDVSVRCCAPLSRILIIGYAAGRIPEIKTNLLLVKNISLIGFNYGYYIGWGRTDVRSQFAPQVRQMIGKVLAAMSCGEMPLPVTQRFAFADWETAIDTTMSRRSIGKVILDMP